MASARRESEGVVKNMNLQENFVYRLARRAEYLYALPTDKESTLFSSIPGTGGKGLVSIVDFNGIASISISGILDWEANYGDVRYSDIADKFEEVTKDPQVTGIQAYITSWGGTVKGLFSAISRIKAAITERKQEDDNFPVYVHIPSHATSAGWALATSIAGSSKFLTSSAFAEVGSVGTILIRPDWSKVFQAIGISIAAYRNPEEKALGHYFEAISEAEHKQLTERVAESTANFIKLVVNNGFASESFWSNKRGNYFEAGTEPTLFAGFVEGTMATNTTTTEAAVKSAASLSQLQAQVAELTEKLQLQDTQLKNYKLAVMKANASAEVTKLQAVGKIASGAEANEAMTKVYLKVGSFDWLQYVIAPKKQKAEAQIISAFQPSPSDVEALAGLTDEEIINRF